MPVAAHDLHGIPALGERPGGWGAHMLSLVGDAATADDAHGTPAQRKGWFLYGYKTGNARACYGAYR